MTEFLPLSSLLSQGRDGGHATVLLADGNVVSWSQVMADVNALRVRIDHPNELKAVFACEDVYHFAVGFLALIASARGIVIGPNVQPETVSLLARDSGGFVLNDAMVADACGQEPAGHSPLATMTDMQSTTVTMYTSGSTGQPKQIVKPVSALEAEIAMLDRQWGARVEGGLFLSSVTHYHAYGLPLHVLWALCSGNVLGAERILYPEILMRYKNQNHVNFISSPAFLNQFVKGVDDDVDYRFLKAVWSAGSPLPDDTAAMMARVTGREVTEIYGSTETGVVAGKTLSDDGMWSCVDDVAVTVDEEGRAFAASLHIGQDDPIELSDRIEMTDGGRFRLTGRNDRIVKIYEKRVSLDNLERSCQECPLITAARIIPLDRSQRLAGVAILSEEGKAFLNQQGKKSVVVQIREYLRQSFDLVVLPRKWRFVEAFPHNDMGKIQQSRLQDLFLTKGQE